ncbi:hypothetical protein NZNM25_10060 [Nitrosopumilus zosterae]|uniref:Uncharacterized protein n=1 Tax=Nitrosopumilus zosterae TaxID=718286 RepID=A0A2S2KRY0_9ARCH|nr:hypothetical protein NZNM25_10060 [Nitrosopumilus zosterae]
MQAATQCKAVITYKSFALIGRDAKNTLPIREEITYDAIGLSCLIRDEVLENYTYQTKRRCI